MKENEKKHQRNIAAYGRQVDKLFHSAAREAALIAAAIGVASLDKLFSFDNYPAMRKRLEKLLSGLKNGLSAVIVNGINSEWTLSNKKNNGLASQVFGNKVGKLSEELLQKYYNTNDKARKAFIERTEAGMSLSDRVWRYTEQFKSEIEMGIDIGLRDGLSADEMSRELQQYLRYPDKLFRRVRDVHGNLVLSKVAKAFHPGRGVYRSSYKNARRLAATECNMAYRTADYERWKELDFVVGIRVVLSNNHTLRGKPLEDICDQLSAPFGSKATSGRGCYPKDFKFTGWHPLCRCHTESILKTREEMDADNARILAGEPASTRSVNTVDDVPKEFKDWLKDNKKRAERSTSVPYFIKDNEKYLPDGYQNLYALKTPYSTYAEYETAMRFNRKHADFTPEIIKNNRDLDQALPVMQGKIMNFTEADRGHANPHYGDENSKIDGYKDNCQTCTVAFELRRRGFPVEALPNKDDEFYNVWCVKNKFDWEERFLNPDGTRPKRVRSGYDVKDAIVSKKAFLEEASKETGRYEVYMDWKGDDTGAHVFIIERQKDGNLLWFDPQSGKRGDYSAFSGFLKTAKRFNMTVLRIDDKIINPKFAERLIKASK